MYNVPSYMNTTLTVELFQTIVQLAAEMLERVGWFYEEVKVM